jgi:hypothetical protein
VHVAVVVDTGSGVSAACVSVAPRTTGLALLYARASALHKPAPRINGDGFVCAIDGVPATGCGEDQGAKNYWSYWQGDGSWSYSNTGAGLSRVDPSVVEGWRFESTTGAKSAPGGSASASSTCPPPAPPQPQSNAPPPNPALSPPPVAQPLTGGGHSATATTQGRVASPGGLTTTRPAGGATAAVNATTVPSSVFIGNDPVVAHHSSSGPPVGLIVGLALVAVLAGAGVTVARRRSRAAS